MAIYTSENSVVMYLNNRKCRVTLDMKFDDCGYPESAKISIQHALENEPLTVSGEPNEWYKFGGFPEFVQSPVEPIKDGKPYTFICCIRECWGDCGNANIFALITESDNNEFIVDDVYVESSCC